MSRLLLLAPILAACGSHSETSKLPSLQPQCDYVNYHHDESVNVQGPGQCTTDCDCDGVRSCTQGRCEGEARPKPGEHCDDPSYKWNEAWNGGGDGVCANDCECNGTRTCQGGHCTATPVSPAGAAITR